MNEESQSLPESVINELLCIADTKWILGHWYIKTMRNGRGLTDFNALAAMSQDQLGHTRALFSFLEQRTAVAPNALEFGRQRDQIHSMALLDSPPVNWADFVITALLAELALQTLFNYSNEKDVGLAALSLQSRSECEFHILYFDGILQGLSDVEKAAAADSLAIRLPLICAWFTAAENEADDPIRTLGYRSDTLATIYATFLTECRQRLASAFLEISLAAASTARSTSEWDTVRRRPYASALPPTLWEFVLPTNEQATMCRRPLHVSTDDSIRFTTGV